MTCAPGARLGPYLVLAPVGAGGMGEVYRATDVRLGRSVAIKVLPPEVAGNATRRHRLEREARVISRLSHPNICALHDVGEQDGVVFLVMEYLDGESLARRLRRGPLPAGDLLRHAVEIAGAIEHANRSRVVHRDLKPANVMLTEAGAKLLDFGLAKALAPPTPDDERDVPGAAATASSPGAGPAGTESLTGEGTILGTTPYLAPEQAGRKGGGREGRHLRFRGARLRNGDRTTCLRGREPGERDCGHPGPRARADEGGARGGVSRRSAAAAAGPDRRALSGESPGRSLADGRRLAGGADVGR